MPSSVLLKTGIKNFHMKSLPFIFCTCCVRTFIHPNTNTLVYNAHYHLLLLPPPPPPQVLSHFRIFFSYRTIDLNSATQHCCVRDMKDFGNYLLDISVLCS